MLQRNYAERAGRGNASVPSLIKCSGCKTTKPSGTFSANQLEILRKKMRENARVDVAKALLISCTSCTSQQVVELECQGCDRWMGLDKFSKTQRKNPDNAQCIECVEERVAVEPYEPGHDDDDHHGSDQHGSDSSDEDEYDAHEVHGAAGALGALSVGQNPSTFPSQYGSDSTTGGGGGVQLKSSTAPTSARKASWPSVNSAGTSSTVNTARVAFNPSAYGGGGGSSSSGKKKATGGRWAKPPAGPPKPAKKLATNDDEDDEDKQLISDSD